MVTEARQRAEAGVLLSWFAHTKEVEQLAYFAKPSQNEGLS